MRYRRKAVSAAAAAFRDPAGFFGADPSVRACVRDGNVGSKRAAACRSRGSVQGRARAAGGRAKSALSARRELSGRSADRKRGRQRQLGEERLPDRSAKARTRLFGRGLCTVRKDPVSVSESARGGCDPASALSAALPRRVSGRILCRRFDGEGKEGNGCKLLFLQSGTDRRRVGRMCGRTEKSRFENGACLYGSGDRVFTRRSERVRSRSVSARQGHDPSSAAACGEGDRGAAVFPLPLPT